MAWCPFVTKWELQPESDAQPAIRATQVIFHSIAAPWTPRRTYEFWRDSTNLESHLGVGYDGSAAQYIGTETRADANYLANRRADGTGALSVETAANLENTDPWTAEQMEALIDIGVWAHQHPVHRIPLRICQSWDDPGFGFHRLHPQWSKNGTYCPGNARVKQFREIVFPGIVARATGREEDMGLTKDDLKTLAKTDGVLKSPHDDSHPNKFWTLESYQYETYRRVKETKAAVLANSAAISELAKALAAHDQSVDPEALVQRIEAAIENVSIELNVTD